MSTSETSTTNALDKKIQALSILPSLAKDREWLAAFIELWDISVPLAIAVRQEWVSELSDRGVEEIERCFNALALTIGQTESELLDTIIE